MINLSGVDFEDFQEVRLEWLLGQVMFPVFMLPLVGFGVALAFGDYASSWWHILGSGDTILVVALVLLAASHNLRELALAYPGLNAARDMRVQRVVAQWVGTALLVVFSTAKGAMLFTAALEVKPVVTKPEDLALASVVAGFATLVWAVGLALRVLYAALAPENPAKRRFIR